jgi:RimJ/RimL family protein N-acetyltransferase
MLDDLRLWPVLESARLRLAPLQPGDADALTELTDEPSILSIIHFLPNPFTRADAIALIAKNANGQDCFCGIWEGGALIGVLGVHFVAPGADGAERVEIGYWLGPAARGAGYATEAAKRALAHLVEAAPERRVVAHCLPANDKSLQVLERLGFRRAEEAGFRPERHLFILPR